MSVDKRRPATGAAMGCGGLKRAQANFGVGAVDLGEVEIRKIRD